jgi:hypothetical protein
LGITIHLPQSHTTGVEEMEEEVHVDLTRAIVSRVRKESLELALLDDEHARSIHIRTSKERGVVEAWLTISDLLVGEDPIILQDEDPAVARSVSCQSSPHWGWGSLCGTLTLLQLRLIRCLGPVATSVAQVIELAIDSDSDDALLAICVRFAVEDGVVVEELPRALHELEEQERDVR